MFWSDSPWCKSTFWQFYTFYFGSALVQLLVHTVVVGIVTKKIWYQISINTFQMIYCCWSTPGFQINLFYWVHTLQVLYCYVVIVIHNNGIASMTLVWDQHAEFSFSSFFLRFYISSFSHHFYNYLNKRRSSVDSLRPSMRVRRHLCS